MEVIVKHEKILWAGFSGGKLHTDVVNDFFGGDHHSHRPALFLTRREAREQYEDVRKVVVTVRP